MEKCGEHSCSDRFLKAGLIALLALILCGAAIGAAGAANPFPADGVLVNGQTYTLDEDIVLTNNLTVPAGVTCTIDLRGYVLKGNGNGTVITINGPDGETPAGNLTLKDTDGEDLPATTPHYFTFVDDGPWTLDTSTPTSFVDLVNFDRVVAKAAVAGTYHVKITGGVITGGSTAEQSYGGGVNVLNGSFTMSGGNIVGNTTGKDAYGGGVCVYEGSTFTMSGGNIVGNYAYSGGGVYVEGSESSASTFIMTDGSITGNSVKYSGGGVYVHHFSTRHGIFTMSGGKIVGNRASVGSTTSNGGGVNVVDGATFNVSGSPVIKDNMKNAKGGDVVDNVYFYDVEVITTITVTDTLSAPAEIWVAQDASSTEAFATGDNAVLSASAKYFHPDTGFAGAIVGGGSDTDKLYWDTNPALIKYNGNLYYGKADTTHLLAIIGGTGSPFTSTNAGYDKDSHTLTLKENQNVSLVHTLEIVAPKTHGNPFTIDLNGQVLQRSAADGTPDFSVITINPGAELAVTDNSSGKHYFKYVKDGAWTYAGDELPSDSYDTKFILIGTETGFTPFTREAADTAADAAAKGNKSVYIKVTGGCITGGNVTGHGGGVHVEGMFSMSGGNIIGNNASQDGGGVCIWGDSNPAKFSMSGGSIAGNYAPWGGGLNIKTQDQGSAGMTDGMIIGNTAGNSAGGVYIANNNTTGAFTMSGGSIIGNKATNTGGGVRVGYGDTFTMSGDADITGNTAASGGGVYVSTDSGNAAQFTMNGGSIKENTATSSGCGVFVNSGCTFSVSGTPKIKDNKKDGAANNVYLDSGPMITLTGPFTGEIYVSNPEPAGGNEQFGTGDQQYAGFNRFISDAVDASGKHYLGEWGADAGGTFPLQWMVAAKAHPITISAGIEHGSVTASISAAEKTAEITLTATPDAGYELDKWDVKDASSNPITVTGNKFTMPDSAVTVSATFKKSEPVPPTVTPTVTPVPTVTPTPVPPTTATVTFNVQGHGTAPASQTVEIGEKVSEPSPAPSAEYYTFGGWYTDSGCAEDTKWNFDTPVSSDMTLYAKWTIAYYAAKVDNYTYGSIPPLPHLLPEDLSDAEYFYSTSAAGELKPWGEMPQKLDAGTYYIWAFSQSHPGEIHPSVFTVEKAPRQAAPEFTATEKDGEITLTISLFSSSETYMYCIKEAGQEDKWIPVTKGTTTIAGLKAGTTYEIKVKINAKGNYKESISDARTITTGSTFTVSYSANGGVGTIEPQTGTAEQPVTVASSDGISREGYRFDSWTTGQDGSGESYGAGSTITHGAVLYAQWLPLPYTITFNGNGGMVSQSSLPSEYGKSISLSAVTASRSGYIHTGWAVSPTGSAVYAPAQEVKNLGNITFYAVWTPESKAHTFKVAVDSGEAYVKLSQGGTTIHSGYTDGGQIVFDNVAEGTYSLVVQFVPEGSIVTRGIIISGDQPEQIVESVTNTSSVVKVSPENGTPAAVVDGADVAAKEVAEYGKFVTLTVKIEAKIEGAASPEEQQTQIEIGKIKEKASPDMELQHLGITVEKTVADSGKSETSTLTSTANVLEFIIPYDFTAKKDVRLYRCHDGTAKELKPLSERPGSADKREDGTYWLDQQNSRIFLYASQFSTYSVGYVPVSPKPSHSSKQQGTSVWATSEPTEQPTPTPTIEPTQGVPTVKPTTQIPTGKSPAPFIGILAGLGAAAAVFGLRRK